jgi:hypothetical protein
MIRVLALGLLLAATAPGRSIAAQSPQDWLIESERLTDKVSLAVASQPERVSVHVSRESTPDGTPLPERALQVWVLSSDGTALRPRDPARPSLTFGTTSNGWTDWRSVFSFEPSDRTALAAVAVSVNGALFVRPIPQKAMKEATIVPPTGYRMPTDADYTGDWQDFRTRPTKPFTVRADLNGDGLQDEAWLLPATSPTGWALFAFLGSSTGQRPVIFLDTNTSEPVQRMGISAVPPGKHQTMCGKGYEPCRPGEPSVLDLRLPAINLFVFESANSFFWWDSQAGRFQRTWISD